MDYFELIKTNSNLLRNLKDKLATKIILDPGSIEAWRAKCLEELSQNNQPASWADIGIILDDPYYLVVRDLVQFPNGRMNGYNRILSKAELTGGQAVGVLPVHKKRILVMKQYRHPTRLWEYEIPRGYGEPNTSPSKQARIEILEEIQGKIGKLYSLGSVNENSGVVAFPVVLFMAELSEVGKPNRDEGIKSLIWLPIKEFEKWIAVGKISDGFTIAAYTRAKLRKLI